MRISEKLVGYGIDYSKIRKLLKCFKKFSDLNKCKNSAMENFCQFLPVAIDVEWRIWYFCQYLVVLGILTPRCQKYQKTSMDVHGHCHKMVKSEKIDQSYPFLIIVVLRRPKTLKFCLIIFHSNIRKFGLFDEYSKKQYLNIWK